MITLKVFDILGKEATSLVNEEQSVGSYKFEFSARGGYTSAGDAQGLASGIYFYTLKAAEFISTKKLILLK